jgi:PKD repeat protein
MAFSPDGMLYVLDNGDNLYSIEKSNGNISILGHANGLEEGPYNRTGDMAFSPDGTLYVVTYESLYTIDLMDLTATLLYTDLIDVPGYSVWTGLAYCDGLLIASNAEALTELSAIFSIDSNTGNVNLLFYVDTYLNDLSSCPADVNVPPNARFTYSPMVADVSEVVSFDATTSDGPNGTIVAYEWRFGNGDTALGPNVNYQYTVPESYTVTLTVTDNEGATDSASATVTVSEFSTNQPPTVDAAGPDQTVTLPDSASLDGTVTDDGPPVSSTVMTTWNMQSGPGTVTFGNTGFVDTTASFSDDGTYVLRLETTDGNKSAFDEVTTTVDPDSQAPSLNPTWAAAPHATGTSSISMTATTVFDPSGVEYYFEETSGNPGDSDSGWQDNASYTDRGLNAVTKYNYRVQARDKSANQNQTVWSSESSATTDAPKSGCGAAPIYPGSGRTNLLASNSVGNALLPLLPSMMALGLWRVKMGTRNRKKR